MLFAIRRREEKKNSNFTQKKFKKMTKKQCFER